MVIEVDEKVEVEDLPNLDLGVKSSDALLNRPESIRRADFRTQLEKIWRRLDADFEPGRASSDSHADLAPS